MAGIFASMRQGATFINTWFLTLLVAAVVSFCLYVVLSHLLQTR